MAKQKDKEFDDSNRAALWPNRFKAGDKHPDYTGKANVTCLHCSQSNELRIAGWDRESDNENAPIMGLQFSEPRGN